MPPDHLLRGIHEEVTYERQATHSPQNGRNVVDGFGGCVGTARRFGLTQPRRPSGRRRVVGGEGVVKREIEG